MLHDRFADIEALGPARGLGQRIEAAFNFGGGGRRTASTVKLLFVAYVQR